MRQKLILAYSGGLDTTVAIKWLQENYDVEVIAVLIDLGQPDNLNDAYERALKTGASKAYIIDAKDEFINDYIYPSLKANAKYEKRYTLATAIARPLIAKILVDFAKKENASMIAHGCTAKGNDQVRFDVGIRSLNPDIKIIAPMRVWKLSREEEIEYAQKNNIKINVTKKSIYSIDENLWGRSIECGNLEDPWSEPLEEIYKWSKISKNEKDNEYIEIDFESGVPVSLNGQKLKPLDLILEINKIAGSYGIGRIDMVENRLIGIKSREIYEAPAAEILIESHRQLESLVLDRELLHFKYLIEDKISEMIYYGLWFTPLMKCLKKFVEESQEYVSGTVKIKLEYKSFNVVGRKSPYSIYDYNLATYDKNDMFDPKFSESFIKIWGYPYEILAKKGRLNG
ncbi:MAG: argininosuccinate synthase [Actinobacteria bacterium]|nr:argininosuccinate synthase [Cyanobacteriota bacterium]MCL5772234.1 argininosuccinate synthase [Actinomycetota bacterium]